jgi:hypothetical protein
LLVDALPMLADQNIPDKFPQCSDQNCLSGDMAVPAPILFLGYFIFVQFVQKL